MQVRPSEGQFVRLGEVLPEIDTADAGAVTFDAVERDSRRVQPGDLFVAMAGPDHDGLEFADEAIHRGCAAVVADRRPRTPLAAPLVLVPDARQAYGQLCHAVAGYPSRQLKVIGVTGTNGKTTTSCLIASILNAAGFPTGLIGTLGVFDGEEFGPSGLTTPPADELARWLARMAINGCTHAVMEVSSHALDQNRTAGVELDAACVTNVRRDHLDYHPSIEAYRRAKSQIFRLLAGEGFAVLNVDDPTAAGYLTELTSPVLTVGMQAAAELTAIEIERFVSEHTFLLTAGSETIPVRTKMIGTHHVYNCLVAAAVGLAYGIDLPTIVRGLENLDHVPGRLERIECGQPFSVFVDFAHTPDALAGVLSTLREVVRGRILCVFGAGGNRDQEKRPLMGRAVEQAADVAVLTNDNPRNEPAEQIVRDLLDGFHQPCGARVMLDRAQAIGWTLAQARPGDCVVIAGKGHENYQIIGDRRIPFDDRDVAKAWLYEHQPCSPANLQ
ncbi:MAG: UDP-N-acetylmuramoyl-L-alanyl-D-glutamate--2,6-diaminopimelate ligase [Planctomycetaceae bacterium]|nr:UDP-N-acetylmuramoyl-L-alanyl-D-glutamate--2,6-diaminopimelate ligase [Planctomycetaceae bacterium]